MRTFLDENFLLNTKAVRNLLRRMNVEVVCTTDDPLDHLNYHQQIATEGEPFKMLPAFRPDKAMEAGDVSALNEYIIMPVNILDFLSNEW